jgi:methionyl-tRNA synthetase
VVTLARKAFGGRTPPEPCFDNPLIPVAREVRREYREAMDQLAFQNALRALWRLLAEANHYLVEREPWKKIAAEGATPALSRILWNGLESVRIVATGLLPFMPTLAPQVLRAVAGEEAPTTLAALRWGGTPTDAPLAPLAPLFPRIDKEKLMSEIAGPAPAPAPQAATNVIDIAHFSTVELRVGKVLVSESVPKSERLLRLEVDLGEPGPRQVIAGIAQSYRPEELVGTEVVIVANLKPAKLMGLQSQGMVLAATDSEGRAILVRPHAPGVAPGTLVK